MNSPLERSGLGTASFGSISGQQPIAFRRFVGAPAGYS
jgi:hypothetical protein